MESKAHGLERPLIVQLAAAVMIATPIMDILASHFAGAYLFDPISWLLVFAGGVTLMIRHKSLWIASILLGACFLGYNAPLIVQSAVSGGSFISQMPRVLACSLVAFAIGIVFYFFRRPYLDRRQHWLAPTGARFAVETAVILNGKLQASSLDLSYTGARIAVPQDSQDFKAEGFKKGDRVSLLLVEINDLLCQAKVLEVQDSYIRVQFQQTSGEEQELIRQWLSSQNLPKA